MSSTRVLLIIEIHNKEVFPVVKNSKTQKGPTMANLLLAIVILIAEQIEYFSEFELI